MENVAIVVYDDRVRGLDNGIIEFLLHSGIADAPQDLIEGNGKQARNAGRVAIPDTELVAEITDRTVELRAIVQPDVIHAKSHIIQKSRTECMGPIHDLVLNWSIRESRT